MILGKFTVMHLHGLNAGSQLAQKLADRLERIKPGRPTRGRFELDRHRFDPAFTSQPFEGGSPNPKLGKDLR
jgi:hypothetical protein